MAFKSSGGYVLTCEDGQGVQGSMTWILGISSNRSESGACLIHDGKLAASALEAKLAPPGPSFFPQVAIPTCLASAGIGADAIDHVAFYGIPSQQQERRREAWLHLAPRGHSSFARAAVDLAEGNRSWLSHLENSLGRRFGGPLHFVSQHDSLAASAFFTSPFQEAALLTVGNSDEWATTSIAHGKDNRLIRTQELRFPHSLERLFLTIANYLGFNADTDGTRIAELALQGTPAFEKMILRHFVYAKPDGSFRLNTDHFDFSEGPKPYFASFVDMLGGPPRKAGDPIEQRHKDLAASLLCVAEGIMLSLTVEAHRVTGTNCLCMAGSQTLLRGTTAHALQTGPFQHVWFQPSGDQAPGALGCALFTWYQTLGNQRLLPPADLSAEHPSSLTARTSEFTKPPEESQVSLVTHLPLPKSRFAGIVASFRAELVGLLAILFYFLVVTPLGACFRLGRRDPLATRKVKVASFWISSDSPPSPPLQSPPRSI